MNKFDIQ